MAAAPIGPKRHSAISSYYSRSFGDQDYDMYYEVWKQFDPDGSGYIKLHQLADFIDTLEPPLKLEKPTKFKIVMLDVNIYEGDKVYCVELLDELILDLSAREGNAIEEMVENVENLDRPNLEPVSSTIWRQREQICAKIIQNAWRRHTSGETMSEAKKPRIADKPDQ